MTDPCSSCKQQASAKHFLHRLPNILIVHLKKFVSLPDGTTWKRNELVSFEYIKRFDPSLFSSDSPDKDEE